MSRIVGDPVNDLLSLLRTTSVFKPLRDPELIDLAARMTIRELPDGAVMVRQDEVADELVVPIAGTLRATMTDRRGNERQILEVTPGDTIGEMNLFSPMAALASVFADGSVRIASLTAAAFQEFCDACPSGALHVIEAMRPRLRRQRLAAALHRSEMFRDVHPDALVALESEFELIPLYGGEVLFKQGDVGDSLYVVMSGRLRVVAASADGERVLAELGAGETVGEMAVLSGEPRSATVYAVRDTQLARLTTAAVKHVIERHPHAMMDMLTGRLVERVRTMSRGERRRSEVVTIGVVPADDSGMLPEFCAALTMALSRMGSVVQLTSTIVDRHLGRPGVSQAHDRDGGGTGVVEWLAQQEAAHRFVVYEADARLTPWTERCVRQADRLVVVARAGGDPAPGEIEAELLAHGPGHRTPVTLALLHADGQKAPSGTARWLHGRSLERHLHIRRDEPADFERLARFLTGNALGIALGGGFARGLAHLGVLRAMAELGIPVDAIGGASMGAMVGAQWACGSNAPQIVHEMRTGFAESFDDMTLPFLAFKRGGKASGFVRRLFNETRIEDLWLPFFCVSANLNRAELKVHAEGRLADAVLASSRAPGIFPPMVIDGELHVDGGLINNVPVDVMKRFVGEGLVIGVDVSPPHELNHVHDYGEDVPGWRAAWLRFNPARDRRIYHPSILLVLMRVIEFGGISYRREKAELADVYISPSVLRFKRNDFALADEIAASGYEAARDRLREWLGSASPAARRQRPDLFMRD
jgi:NTE family protein/lysophospholipid hydrolase